MALVLKCLFYVFLEMEERVIFIVSIPLVGVQGGDYVPVRQNRGCFEAVIEVILKI